MSTLIKKKIVISCVIFEVARIVSPVKRLNADRVHLIKPHNRIGTPNYEIYNEFYNEVIKQIKENNPDCEIKSYLGRTYEFTDMLSIVLAIINEEKANNGDSIDVYVNITAGSSEYSAAALIASMMEPWVNAFNTSVREYTISGENVRDVFYCSDGKTPIGLAKSVNEPMQLLKFHIEKPKDELIKGLKVFHGSKVKKNTTIIKALEEEGIWTGANMDNDNNQSRTMHYQRNFMDIWKKKGWVEVDGREKWVTKQGEEALKIFDGSLQLYETR